MCIATSSTPLCPCRHRGPLPLRLMHDTAGTSHGMHDLAAGDLEAARGALVQGIRVLCGCDHREGERHDRNQGLAHVPMIVRNAAACKDHENSVRNRLRPRGGSFESD